VVEQSRVAVLLRPDGVRHGRERSRRVEAHEAQHRLAIKALPDRLAAEGGALAADSCVVGDLLIALAGGTVGAVVTALIGLWRRFRTIPGEVDKHDRLIKERDEDLAQWVADDHLRLRRELQGITTRLASQGHLYSGAHGRALEHAKELALHGYRDQERQAERFVAEIEAGEGALHARHREREHKPFPSLTTPDAAQPVLDRWRDSLWMHPPGVQATEVQDPTRRTLEQTVEQLDP
jgi:hypothetical protein